MVEARAAGRPPALRTKAASSSEAQRPCEQPPGVSGSRPWSVLGPETGSLPCSPRSSSSSAQFGVPHALLSGLCTCCGRCPAQPRPGIRTPQPSVQGPLLSPPNVFPGSFLPCPAHGQGVSGSSLELVPVTTPHVPGARYSVPGTQLSLLAPQKPE